MSRRKHRFNEPEPTTTGSIRRAYRKNIRCDKSHGVRTDLIFSKECKALHGLPQTADDCELWEVYLLGIEHSNRLMREGDTATRQFIASLFKPLPEQDYLRNIYKRLKERFEPQMKLGI